MRGKMGKIVGKYLCSILRRRMYLRVGLVQRNFIRMLLLLFALPLCAKIELATLDMQGQPLEQAGVGQPFILEVMVGDASGSLQAPTIEGIDQFHVKRTGLYMSSINGKSTTKFSYQIRIDEPGEYKIGPAKVTHRDNQMSSDTLNIMVRHEQKARINKKQRKTQPKALLRLLVDNDHVVIGQKVLCTLRFYYNDPVLELNGIVQPDFAGFRIKNSTEPQAGTAKINDVQYHYAEWQWEVYPTKEGQLIIPAFSADFSRAKHDHFFGGFSVLLSPRRDHKRVYSNAVKLHVDPLPAYDGPVHAIGSFERMRASIKPGVAKEGEGMVLTLEITGEGDLDEIPVPTLHGMPEELKYYDSNSSIVAPLYDGDLPKKQFEYIVQGRACGDWEIPKQLFTYFDVETRTYKILQSAPLAVTVVPGAASTVVQQPYFVAEQKASDGDKPQLQPLNTKAPWYPVKEHSPVPWVLFDILFAIPLLWGLFPFMQRLAHARRNRDRWQKRQAFIQARKELKHARVEHNAKKIYAILVNLVASCNKQSSGTIGSSDSIQTQLRTAGFDDLVITMWETFLNRAMQAAFGGIASVENDRAFFEAAEQWIDRLEKIF